MAGKVLRSHAHDQHKNRSVKFPKNKKTEKKTYWVCAVGDPEIIEKRFPVIVRKFERRIGSGGIGKFMGGDGVIRELEFRRPVTLSILSERRALRPFGMKGGGDGMPGRNLFTFASDGRVVNIGGKAQVANVQAGDVIRIESPGGGAWGSLTESLM